MLFVVWLAFYFLRKDLRKEILIMSLLASPLGLFDLLYVPTYWIPHTFLNIPVGIEGIFFSFLIGGIAAGSYAEISHRKLRKFNKYHKKFSILVVLIIIPTILIIQHFYLINISIAMYFALLIGTALAVFIRKDLLKSSIMGAIIFGLIYSIALIIWINIFPSGKDWFILKGLPKVFLLNAPIYEIIFSFLFGAYWGNLYELLFSYRFK